MEKRNIEARHKHKLMLFKNKKNSDSFGVAIFFTYICIVGIRQYFRFEQGGFPPFCTPVMGNILSYRFYTYDITKVRKHFDTTKQKQKKVRLFFNNLTSTKLKY